MLQDLQKSTQLGRELSHAIQRNELITYFQAQVDLLSGEVRAFEALLRWNHPRLGIVAPSVFIPIAESNGLIEGLGGWILRESCKQAANWIAMGHQPREVAVNVSAIQLGSKFVDEVKCALTETGLPPHLLCLELTESIYAGSRSNGLRDAMFKLKSLGVKLALDDFGTGYSSLSYLGRFPFDKIKLDRSFVSGADSDADRRRLLSGIANLAKALGFALVAEGAETDAEVMLLQEIGVDCIQGYAFARPESADEALETAFRMPYEFKRRFNV